MTYGEALQSFFSRFDIPAKVSTAVEAEPILPYLTYEYKTSSLNDPEVNITCNVYYYTSSEAVPNAKAKEIEQSLPCIIECDGGAIWLKRGSPFCSAVAYNDEPNLKRRMINITAEYLTK